MAPKSANCPICGGPATESGVPQKLDSRIGCPRCKDFDIDRRARINLRNSRPDNWPILSGLARACWERGDLNDLPRLVWIEVEGSRDGKYQFQNIANQPIRSVDKVFKLLEHLLHRTNRTAGELVCLKLPNDLSLAFASSPDELGAIVKQLERDGLVESFRKSPDEYQISLTIQGADHEIADPKKADVVSEEAADVEITGSPKGSGAFGRVYPGIQKKLKRQVAIKIIEAQAGPDAIAHAQGLAKVSHPNVVAVHDVGRVKHPITREIVDCVIMELIDGHCINKVWASFEESDAVSLCKQVVDGLEAMHAAGVCHHDLHAGNVLVSGCTLKIIDIQYTETARLSQLQSELKEQLLEADCNAAARLCRNTLWQVNKNLLTPIIEDRLNMVRKLSELREILVELDRVSISSVQESQVGNELLSELSNVDRQVLKLAGDQLVTKDRFVGRISVPVIVDEVGNHEQVESSIRLLTELGYFQDPYRAQSGTAFLSTYGFEEYLQAFRDAYGNEQTKICAEILRKERCRDLDIVATTELPRPIVEHVINVLTSKNLIDSSRYNSETHINSVSEQLRRKIQGT